MEIIEKTKQDLPNSTTIMVLGILSLIFCWCYGIIGLIMGIIAVVMASTQRKLYLDAPDQYTESSLKNVNTGRTCGIIAICISAVVFVFLILVFLGVAVMGLGSAALGL